MKKYVKPELIFESFELSQQIAACAWDMARQWDVENCYAKPNTDMGMPDYGVILFSKDPCNFEAVENENFCYTTGSDEMKLFNS